MKMGKDLLPAHLLLFVIKDCFTSTTYNTCFSQPHTVRTAPALRVTYCSKCYRSFGDYFTKTFASRKCFTFGNV